MDSIFKLLNELLDNETIDQNEVIDLSTEEGFNEINKNLDQLEQSTLGKFLVKNVLGKDIDELRKLVKDIYEETNKPKIDTSLKDIKIKQIPKLKEKKEESKKKEEKLDRPSLHVDVNVGLQIHKLVQEYVDTMIKPYAKGLLDTKIINDIYAGIYEYSCWLHEHK